MRIPKSLVSGDTIAFVAPACGCPREPARSMVMNAKEALEERGYSVIIGDCVFKEDGKGISTDPRDAAAELMTMYLDPKVKALISAGGGETMCEILPYLDLKKLRSAKPKWFIGISDNTNFIFTLATLCNTAAIYGPVVPDFRKPFTRREEDSLGLMEGKVKSVKGYEYYADPLTGYNDLADDEKYHLNKKKELRCFLPDERGFVAAPDKDVVMEGMLLGGCLDVLVNLCGTRFDHVRRFVRHKKIIWVLEACDLTPMGIRRAMWELRQSGWLDSAQGFLIGHPLAAYGVTQMGVDEYNAVLEMISGLNVPVIMDADVGHINPNMPLVIGAKARVRAFNNYLEADMNF